MNIEQRIQIFEVVISYLFFKKQGIQIVEVVIPHVFFKKLHTYLRKSVGSAGDIL